VVSALDHPAAEKAPFGRAVAERAAEGGGWMSWCVAVDDLTPFEARLGRPARQGHRIRPDGFELNWKQIGVLEVMEDAQLPFFVEWSSPADQHPSHGGGAVVLERVEMCGDPEAISEYLGADHEVPLDGIAVDWIDDADLGLNAVWFSTPHGSVRID
jgi:hypothetical protein